MAVHARHLKALVVYLTVFGRIIPLTVPDNRMPPIVQQAEMRSRHVCLLHHSLLGLLGLGRELRIRCLGSLTCIIVEREQKQTNTDNQTGYNLTSVIHPLHPPFLEGVRHADQFSFPFLHRKPGRLLPSRELR